MTCIVAVKKKGKIVMGCDGFCGDSYTQTKEDCVKIVEKDDFLLGISGSALNMQILDLLWELPERGVKDTDYSYVLKKLVPSIKMVLEKNNATIKKDDKIYSSLHAIFIYMDKIYCLGTDFCCLEMGNFAAEGSGTYHALGALEAIYNTNRSAREITEKALNVASKFVNTVNNNFTFKEIDIEN